ncbi:uncharacterized protein METZ01_LOCUS7566 [marine metagenome]|uniref:Uncharacterized protein n=1 Tax=marine metagenome TaxID=408172 RepID=A0A381NJC3_9ZZZZ
MRNSPICGIFATGLASFYEQST